MEQQQVEQLIAIYCNKLPLEAIHVIKDKLLTMDYNAASIILAQAKDPTISILLSVLVGSLGIDRIYIGDTGLGIIKLLTCGGCGIWWLIDLFLIINATKQKNLQLLMGIICNHSIFLQKASPSAKPSSYRRSSLAVSFSMRPTSSGRIGRMQVILPAASKSSTS